MTANCSTDFEKNLDVLFRIPTAVRPMTRMIQNEASDGKESVIHTLS